jgi:hypothetical protein
MMIRNRVYARVREGVPDRRAAAVLFDDALDLVRGGRCAPSESRRERAQRVSEWPIGDGHSIRRTRRAAVAHFSSGRCRKTNWGTGRQGDMNASTTRLLTTGTRAGLVWMSSGALE